MIPTHRPAWRTAAVVATAALISTLAAPSAAFADTVIPFTDSALQGCVELALGLPHGSGVTTTDILDLTSLSCTSSEVENVFPLSHATNLVTLDLDDNNIRSISGLTKLANLTDLRLRDNLLLDSLPKLSGMTSLDFLLLDHNNLSDVSSLSGLKSTMSYLSLTGNYVRSVSSLSSFSSIGHLWLDDNMILDLSPLKNLSSGLVYFDGTGQHRISPDITLNSPVSVPKVTRPSGSHPTISVSSASSAKGKIAKGKVTWTTVGSGILKWNTTFGIGANGTGKFSGTVDRETFHKMKTTKPVITGTRAVGHTLKVSTKGWTSNVDKIYEWVSGNDTVQVDSHSSYKLHKSDKGKRIRVYVFGYRAHYLSVTRVSGTTGKISG